MNDARQERRQIFSCSGIDTKIQNYKTSPTCLLWRRWSFLDLLYCNYWDVELTCWFNPHEKVKYYAAVVGKHRAATQPNNPAKGEDQKTVVVLRLGGQGKSQCKANRGGGGHFCFVFTVVSERLFWHLNSELFLTLKVTPIRKEFFEF